MLRIWTRIQARFLADEGASLVEYALLVALIAAVAILALQALGNNVSGELQDVADTIGGTQAP
jgi:Flp pilus assembly pilin Flp